MQEVSNRIWQQRMIDLPLQLTFQLYKFLNIRLIITADYIRSFREFDHKTEISPRKNHLKKKTSGMAKLPKSYSGENLET